MVEVQVRLGFEAETDDLRKSIGKVIYKELLSTLSEFNPYDIIEYEDDSSIELHFHGDKPPLKVFRLGVLDITCYIRLDLTENSPTTEEMVILYCVDSLKFERLKAKIEIPHLSYIIMFNGFDRDGARKVLMDWNIRQLVAAFWLSPDPRPDIQRKSTYRALKSLNTGQKNLSEEIKELKEEMMGLKDRMTGLRGILE